VKLCQVSNKFPTCDSARSSEAEEPRLRVSKCGIALTLTDKPLAQMRTFTKVKDNLQPIFTTSTTELDVSVSAQRAVKVIESPVL
jgi:hypothetical protein